ncbi:MAG: D-alanyl-D-alanine carboxypeptidase family protein, partial [Spirochaetota bacterium]|nr:D-alanyl-D-alanine carboxypeptidase family protein [Spirochaetota bacterium]
MKKQVIVDHIPLRVKPCYESKTLSDSVKYRDILHGKKIIYNESDFDYLELIWKNKTVYLPTEYLIDYSASTLSNKQPGLPINEENPLPVDFIPEDLREVPGEACRQNSSILLTNETLTQFLAMREAAKNDNIHIYLLKGYLDIAELAKSYRQDYESVFMQNMTEKPACSAHHLGTVLNLTSPEINYRQHPLFCLTEAYNWLSRNAGNFGFFFTTNFESFLQRKNSWKPWQMIYLPYEKSESLPKNDNIPE